MTFEQIKTIVMTVIASLGGFTGIIAIINGIVRIFTAAKQAKATKASTSAYTAIKSDIVAELERRMNCSLDVDISAKLNPVLNELIGSYKATADAANEKLYSMKNLMVEMAKMMATSRKITEDDRVKLYALIDECSSVVEKPVEEVKPKLSVTLEDTREAQSEAVAEAKDKTSARARVTV